MWAIIEAHAQTQCMGFYGNIAKSTNRVLGIGEDQLQMV
jgi:hypothetical protein